MVNKKKSSMTSNRSSYVNTILNMCKNCYCAIIVSSLFDNITYSSLMIFTIRCVIDLSHRNLHKPVKTMSDLTSSNSNVGTK